MSYEENDLSGLDFAVGMMKKAAIPASVPERCEECGAITQALNKHNAKWCCHCGAKLTGVYVRYNEDANAYKVIP